MKLPFNLNFRYRDRVDNYALHFWPNGIYKTKQLVADNYLFPMYFYPVGGEFFVSTSVYALIYHKKSLIRNPKFQTTAWYRPTFLTIDKEIQRARTPFLKSSLEIKDKDRIVELGSRLIQEYITEIEDRYPGWHHLLLMGGKDSQILALANRKSKWIVLSSEPNASLNAQFIKENGIRLETFMPVENKTDNSLLLQEILASDCFFDIAHFRWVNRIEDVVKKHNGKVVIWIGTSGDGIFSKNNNHRFQDYFSVHDLHVGMSMGIWHQMFKNLWNVPVVSPYQSPAFLKELFYRFDPYFVDTAGDVRSQIAEKLYRKPVWFPQKNPFPMPWKRNRSISIPIYIKEVKKEGISVTENRIRSTITRLKEKSWYVFDHFSGKRRGMVSQILFPLRNYLSAVVPGLQNTRHDIETNEIK